MRIIAYTRISIAHEDPRSLEEQEEVIREWAVRLGHEVVALFSDDGVSGKTGEQVGLAEALILIERGDADALAVSDRDRLARNVIRQELALEEVWRRGADAWEARHDRAIHRDDPDDPAAKLIRVVLGAVAEFERDMIVARMQRGRRRKRAEGGFIGGVPYGLRREGERLVPVPEEQAVIKRVRRLARNPKHTLRSIAAHLDSAGVPTRTGGPWGHTTVRNILQA
jgi:DNA invertase Pin-like site-specific DNA recombinase